MLKTHTIQAVLFIAVIALPILTPCFWSVSAFDDMYELVDTSSEGEEQGEESKSEKSEVKDQVEEYILSRHALHSDLLCRLKHATLHKDHFLEIHSEVLTPPPETT